jgi:glycosyltransferase involved in cell wall biosynthesis
MRVNIIIPVKNGVRFIGEAITSALDQPSVARVIVVDDGSTDGSAETAERIGDQRVILIQGTGRGVSAARNLGFAELERQNLACDERDWVMFLDADDRLVPGAIGKLLEGAQTDCVAVYGNYERIDARGQRIGRRSSLLRRNKPSGEILNELLAGNFIVNGGIILIRQTQFRLTGGFDEALRYCEDWHLFCRLAGLGRIIWTPQTTVLEYRVHSDSAMMQGGVNYAHYRAALDRVFADPLIAHRIKATDAIQLRRKAEAHLRTYIACQAIRTRAYGRAIQETAKIAALLPLQMPKALAHTFGALVGL